MRIVINRENFLQKHGKSPKAISLIFDYLDHSGNDKVKTLNIPNHRIAMDICSKDMSNVLDMNRIFKYEIFTVFINYLGSY